MTNIPDLGPGLRRVGVMALTLALLSAPALAQQPVLGTDATRLSEALKTLARSPQSHVALVTAGEASLALDDAVSALRYFRRAEAINPRDARVQAGIASVMVRQGQPLEALRLFAEAQQAGALSVHHISERGLAYDLIGDNARAQSDYATALSAGADPDVTRRLALSQAIGGNQRASEATLLPLLERRDLAAYRTRAFALAILGKSDEAISIAETMLPQNVSGRLAPYLRYMPRLTRAQQALAANLGTFPAAGEIGRDPPALAAFAVNGPATTVTRSADARLVPSGAPMGSTPAAKPPVTVAAATAPPPRQAQPRQPVTSPPAVAVVPAPKPVTVAAVVAPAPKPRAPSVTTPMQQTAENLPKVSPAPQRPELSRVTLAQQSGAQQLGAQQLASAAITSALPAPTQTLTAGPAVSNPEPAPVAAPATAAANAAVVVIGTIAPASVETLPGSVTNPTAVIASVTPPASGAAQISAPARSISLSEAFSEFGGTSPAPVAAPATGAVDITAIQPRREQPVAAVAPVTAVKPAAALTKPTLAKPTPAKPVPVKPPPVPSRHWVQVATGKDTRALASDWRRIKREADGLLDRSAPHTAVWGQSNRLVAGPFPTAGAADQLIGKLKDKKVSAFRFTSAVGEEVKPVD